MIVKYTFKPGTPLSQEQIKMLDELKDRPVVIDEDCPEITKERYEQMKQDTFRHMEVLRERAANGDEAAARTLKRLEDVWSRRGELPRANA